MLLPNNDPISRRVTSVLLIYAYLYVVTPAQSSCPRQEPRAVPVIPIPQTNIPPNSTQVNLIETLSIETLSIQCACVPASPFVHSFIRFIHSYGSFVHSYDSVKRYIRLVMYLITRDVSVCPITRSLVLPVGLPQTDEPLVC
jgi:hypothetical protein